MRRVIPIVLLTGLAGPAEAAFYQINLSNIEPIVDRAYSCPYCGFAGPIFPIMYFNPGDTIDFGSVTLAAHFDERDWERAPLVYDPITGTERHPDPSPLYWLQGNVNESFDPATEPTYYFGGLGTATLSFELTYTIPSWANSIQIGWGYADGVYVPAVPELPTWAMLVVGFILLSLRRYFIPLMPDFSHRARARNLYS